jgi:hypothetical protein
MDLIENSRAVAEELVSFAREQGVDLEIVRTNDAFLKDQRWIWFWRKQDGIPCTGPVDEKEGTLHYNMQGTIEVLPEKLKESATAFRHAWTEAGTVASIEQAFHFLKAWLLDRSEVDELPHRSVGRYGI